MVLRNFFFIVLFAQFSFLFDICLSSSLMLFFSFEKILVFMLSCMIPNFHDLWLIECIP
uniref:Uncharacterized protein n=1 Tax=Arundo donax TaxID=35708 RepID=A0A0A9GMT1_ARUDO